jgi:hypothetical protein
VRDPNANTKTGPNFLRNGCADLHWVAQILVRLFGIGSLLIRPRFGFDSLSCHLQLLALKELQKWFDFGSILIRFWFDFDSLALIYFRSRWNAIMMSRVVYISSNASRRGKQTLCLGASASFLASGSLKANGPRSEDETTDHWRGSISERVCLVVDLRQRSNRSVRVRLQDCSPEAAIKIQLKAAQST